MTVSQHTGGEPAMPLGVELYLATEFQRFAEEATGQIEPARSSRSYLGSLAMGREGLETDDEQVVLTAFSGFVMSELSDHIEQQSLHFMTGKESTDEQITKARTYGDLLLHGLAVLDWSNSDNPEIKALDVVCFKVAMHLVDAVDGYEKLRSYAMTLSRRGLAA